MLAIDRAINFTFLDHLADRLGSGGFSLDQSLSKDGHWLMDSLFCSSHVIGIDTFLLFDVLSYAFLEQMRCCLDIAHVFTSSSLCRLIILFNVLFKFCLL